MLWLRLLILVAVPQDSIPYKANDEFKIRFDLSFKMRPRDNANRVDFEETVSEHQKRTAVTPLPYLNLYINIFQKSDHEVRFKVVNNRGTTVLSRKIDKEKEFHLELGFTDDIKDRVTPYEYTGYLLSDDKKEISRIVIHFTKDGDYMVNGVKRGKI
jgi:hypothetical protein